jgi:subtilase-type serine protease
MHGVSYDAQLIAGSNDESASAIRDVVDMGAKVINGSYGISSMPSRQGNAQQPNPHFTEWSEQLLIYFPDTDDLGPISDEVEALRYAAAHDVVTVYAAGNSYLDHPRAAQHPSHPALIPFIRPENHASGAYGFVVVDTHEEDNDSDEEDAKASRSDSMARALAVRSANHAAGVSRIDDDGAVDDVAKSGVAGGASMDARDPRLQKFDFSDLEGTLIAAVAVGQDKTIASYSNRCGAAWRWCIAAPGGDAPADGRSWEQSGIYTTTRDGGYSATGVAGTSFAAPMVAGSAAILRQAYPYMTARQIIEVLLTSADRTGHLADRAVYGRGLLDLGRAVRGPVEFGAEGFAPVFDVDTKGHDSWWRNDIGGSGGLTKRGSGLLLMTGNNTYAGPTTVKGGTLAVYGSNASSALMVERGATLTGSGTVGRTEVAGTVAPANPGKPLRVAGDYVQQAGSVYAAAIGADGVSADRIHVQGAARIDGAALQVQGIGLNAINREYTLLQADGGIQGGYAEVPDPYLFLDVEQGVRGNDHTRYRFSLHRNATSFAVAAQTANQRAVARALDTAGTGLAPHDAVVMATRPDGLAPRFDQWSGEAHASALSAFSMQAGQMRDGMLGRARVMGHDGATALGSGLFSAGSQAVVQDGTGKATWAQYTGARDRIAGNGNAAGLRASNSGLLIGTDMPVPGSANDRARFGVAAGFSGGSVNVGDRGSVSDADSYALGAYGDARLDSGLRLRYGASHTWHTVSSRRATSGLDTAQSRYRATTAQAFVEAGRPYSLERASVEPYAALAYVNTRRGAFDESGNAGLHADAARQQLGLSTLGVRGGTSWDLQGGSQLALQGGAGWRHAYGGVTPAARMHFAQGDSFQVQGAPVARNALVVEAGASVQSDRGMRISLGYTGQLARNEQSHAVKANLSWAF